MNSETERKLFEKLLSRERNLVMVIGGADTGKTTLIERMADALSRSSPVGVLDLDTGQSHIGPPSTIAWGVVSGGFAGWDRTRPEDICFTGSFNPAESMLQALTGASVIARKARARCSRVIVDTTGMVFEPTGRIFKQCEAELLAPDIVIALERKDELKTVIEALKTLPASVFRIRAPEGVRHKTTARRRRYRAEKFREYFSGSRTVAVSLEETALRFTGKKVPLRKEFLLGRLASLRNRCGEDLALGVISGFSPASMEIKLKTPFNGREGFFALSVGSGEARLEEEFF